LKTLARLLLAQRAFSDLSLSNGYCVFQSEQDAEKAQLGLNGHEFEGRHLRVTMMNAKEMDRECSVFVGNLPFGNTFRFQIHSHFHFHSYRCFLWLSDTEEEELYQVFAACGELEGVRLIRDKRTKIGKGFAIVGFKTAEARLAAQALNGTLFKKREIRVFRALRKPKMPLAKKKQGKELARLGWVGLGWVG